jgi:hypothetical protein
MMLISTGCQILNDNQSQSPNPNPNPQPVQGVVVKFRDGFGGRGWRGGLWRRGSGGQSRRPRGGDADDDQRLAKAPRARKW